MNTPEDNRDNTWLGLYRFTRLKVTYLTIGANLVGALVVACYFMFFDEAISVEKIKDTFIVLGIMFIGLVILASIVSHKWQKDLWHFILLKTEGKETDPNIHRKAQRIILDMPFMNAMVSLINWLLASVIMSLTTALWLSDTNDLSAIFIDAFKTFIGISIGGIVVCAIIFFSVEIVCRRVWPHFFPEGGVIKSPCTFRLKLSTRMLIIFSLASLLPIILVVADFLINGLPDRKIHMGADGGGGEQDPRVQQIVGVEQVFYFAQVGKGRAQLLLEVDRAGAAGVVLSHQRAVVFLQNPE